MRAAVPNGQHSLLRQATVPDRLPRRFGGSICGQNPSYLAERFPTEVRATASGFVYHQGAIWGGLIAPVLTYLAVQLNMGF